MPYAEQWSPEIQLYRFYDASDDLWNYCMSKSPPLHQAQKELFQESLAEPNFDQTTQYHILMLNATTMMGIGAKKCIDLGVFTGSSALSAALAMGEGCKVYAMDISDEHADVCRKYWKKAGVEDRIEHMIMPAMDGLQKLLDEGHGGTVDFIFHDADMANLPGYYSLCMKLLRKGGIMHIDDMLWMGMVLPGNEDESPSGEGILELTKTIKNDDRVISTLLNINNGLMCILKK